MIAMLIAVGNKKQPNPNDGGLGSKPDSTDAAAVLDWRVLTTALPPMIAVDEEGLIAFASDTVRDLLGWDPGELLGQPLATLAPQGTRSRGIVVSLVRRLIAQPDKAQRMPKVFRASRADGSGVWIELNIARVTVPEREEHLLFGILRDVSDRVRAEERLRISERTLRLCLEAASMGVFEWDPESGRVEWDATHHALLGAPSGACSMHALDALALIHAEDRECFAAAITQAVEGGDRFEIEYRAVNAEGGVRWLASVGQRDQDATGRPRLHGVTFDITQRHLVDEAMERHRHDLQHELNIRSGQLDRFNTQLRAAERMIAIGTVAAGLGHDICNVLLPVRIHLESVGKIANDEALDEHLDAIASSIGYLQQLADGLQSMASEPDIRQGRAVSTDIASWWPRVEPLLVKALPRQIEFRVEVPADVPRVPLQEHQLTQAVFNLIVNAGEAIGAALPEGPRGKVTLWARIERRDGRPMVGVGVTDNGPGMSEEVRSRAREMFFTTKERGAGAGIGLALVRSIVELAGGTVEIESRPGEGTTVAMHLPPSPSQPEGASGAPAEPGQAVAEVKPRAARPGASKDRAGAAKGAPVTVLCVDDHALLVEGLKSHFGLDERVRLVGALPTAEGLDAQVKRVRPDIVLLDIEMPGPDAFEAADRLRRTYPGTRVVFLSTYIREGYIAASKRCGASGYFAKADELEDIIDGLVRVTKPHAEPFIVGPQVRQKLHDAESKAGPDADGGGASSLPIESLSPREIEVLRLIGKGLTRAQIAAELSRSAKTIDGHQAKIMKKLGVESRADLVRLAIREGFAEA